MSNPPAPPSRTRTQTRARARSRAFGGALGAAARGAINARRERGVPPAERGKPAGVRVANPVHEPVRAAAPPPLRAPEPEEPEYALLVDDDDDDGPAPEPATAPEARPEAHAEPAAAEEPVYALLVDDDESDARPATSPPAPRPPVVARGTRRHEPRHPTRGTRPRVDPVREPDTVAFAPRERGGAPRPRPRPVPERRAPEVDLFDALAMSDPTGAFDFAGAHGTASPASPGTESADTNGATPGIAVDPRIHARRIAVKRAEGRRRLRVLVVLVGLLTVLTALVIAVYSPMLDVERVDVTGVAPDQVAAIRTAAGVSRGDALLRVDTGRVEARLEALPWIAHASVSRDLPGTLQITVSVRQEIAWVAVPAPKGTGGTTTAAVVDGTGHVMAAMLVAPAGLPQLVGLTTGGRPGSQVRHAGAAHVAAILPADLRNLATTLSVRHGLVTMGVGGGPEIRFGTADHLAAKGRTALAILGSLSHPVRYVDVRVPSAPVTG